MVLFKVAGHREKRGVTELARCAGLDGATKNFIYQSISSRSCFVACDGDEVVAFGVLDYSFFGNGFVRLLYVAPERRRCGIARGLLRHIETQCKTEKLFTSTPHSDEAMKGLLSSLDYESSGVIENITPDGAASLVFFTRPTAAIGVR